MKLRVCSVVTALLLFEGLAGCGEEFPAAVFSATQASTAASLTTSVLSTPTAVEERRSNKDRAVSAVGAADMDDLFRGRNMLLSTGAARE